MFYTSNKPYHRCKAYAAIVALHRREIDEQQGGIRPLQFQLEDGLWRKIDKITDIREAAALKAGGQGMRYTCIVDGNQYYLFHDDDEWFFELEHAMPYPQEETGEG